jgi:hypothetical protein
MTSSFPRPAGTDRALTLIEIKHDRFSITDTPQNDISIPTQMRQHIITTI